MADSCRRGASRLRRDSEDLRRIGCSSGDVSGVFAAAAALPLPFRCPSPFSPCSTSSSESESGSSVMPVLMPSSPLLDEMLNCEGVADLALASICVRMIFGIVNAAGISDDTGTAETGGGAEAALRAGGGAAGFVSVAPEGLTSVEVRGSALAAAADFGTVVESGGRSTEGDR